MKILLVLLLIFCKPELSKKELYSKSNDNLILNLNYGIKPEIPFFKSESEIWKPVVQEKEGNNCLFSHSSVFIDNELGLSLKICSEVFANEKILLESILEGNNKSISINYENKIKVNSTTLSEIISIWKDETPELILSGDRFIENERIISLITPEYIYSLYGEEKNINSSYSLAYFSIWKDKNFWNFAFPEEYVGGRKTSISYIVISLKDTEVNLKKDDIINQINTINTKNLENCTIEPIEFTEILPISSGSTGKFIEWKNPKNEPICLTNFDLVINDKIKSNKSKTGFLLPNEVVLIGEESSKLMLHTDISVDWKELKDDSIISFNTKNYKINYKNEYQKPIKYEEGEVSIKNKQCNNTIKYSKNSKNCFDPGIELSFSKKECNLNDFEVTEINFNSISSDINSKFIELQFRGEENCDLSSLSLAIDDFIFPLSLSSKSITKNEIIILGNPDIFQNINVIKRDLTSINDNSKIKLINNSTYKLLYEKISSSLEYLIKSNKGLTFSLIPLENSWKIHPTFHSKNIKLEYALNIIGSPGEIILAERELQTGYISEINLLGSYTSTDSITLDKFIELDLIKNGDYHLELNYQNGNSIRIEIPSPLRNGKFVFAKNKLTCFPKTENYINESIILNRDIQSIELYSKDKKIDSLEIDSFSGFGIEDRINRVRKSTTRTENLKFWKTSYNINLEDFIKPECYPFTHGTPGFSNSYSEFIERSDRSFDSISILRNFPYSFNNKSNFSVYNNLRISSNFNLTNNKNLELSIPLLPFDVDSLLFVKWNESSELNLLLPNSLIIQALMPLPTNSQNEWILICNKFQNYEYIKNYEIADSNFFDKLIPYGNRFPNKNPLSSTSIGFSLTKDGLNFNECGYIIDPDANNINLKSIPNTITPIFTVTDDSSIGNGISADEPLNLYKIKQNNRVLVSNYGNQYSHNPFSIKALENEIIYLKEGKTGESISDYRVEK